MKLIKKSSRKLIYQSDSFLIFGVAGLALMVGGLALLWPNLANSIACLKDTCYQALLSFRFSGELNTLIGGICGMLLVVLGIGLSVIVPRSRVIFDVARHQLVLEKHWIFLRKLEQRRHPLSEIQAVEVDVLQDPGGDPATYRVVLLLKNGDSIPLDPAYSGSEQGQRNLADQIKGFLALP